MRTCAQLVSYEVSLALSVLGVVMLGRLAQTCPRSSRDRAEFLPFVIPQFVGLVIFFIAGIAETSRAPFDLPEAEAGARRRLPPPSTRGCAGASSRWPSTSTSSRLSALMVTLFFSGWHGPWNLGPLWFLLKLFRRALRFHLAAHDAARGLRYDPADALRLEGAAAGGDDQRRDHPRWWWCGYEQHAAVLDAQGLRRHLQADLPRSRSRSSTRSNKRPVYPRFPPVATVFTSTGNGLEKCVGCSLCAAACPADCIRVVPAEKHARQTASRRASATARIYEINMSRCIFCGYLRARVPVRRDHASGNEFEPVRSTTATTRSTRRTCCSPSPSRRFPVADRVLYDTPIPFYQSNS